MYLCIHGFLPDNDEDDSLKFKLKINGSFNDQIVQSLSHRSLDEMAEGEWLLTNEQVTRLSSIIEQPLPTNLDLFIGVIA